MTDRDESQLAAALRAALEARDRIVKPPRLAAMWTGERSARRGSGCALCALAASAICAIVVVGIVLRSTDRPTPIDAALARQLSSADYWRVPTDKLLAYEAAPLRADLPSPTGFQISLEESVL